MAAMGKTFPLDHGWAWVICLGGFITHVVLGSGGQITSVLFIELVKEFNTTITTASLIFMCHVLAFSISTVAFPAIVLPRLHERWTLMLGGCLLFVASMGCAFSPNIGVFIAFSVLKGTASGCVFVPCSSLIRVYFKNRQSTASVIAYCGGSVAAIVSPFVIRAIRREYGISGAYLIQAAIELNVCVAGMLMRPVSFYGRAPEDAVQDHTVSRENGLLSTDLKAEYPSADKVFLEKGEFNVFSHQFNRQMSVTRRSDQLPTIDEDMLLAGKLSNSGANQGKVFKGGSIKSLPAKVLADGKSSNLQSKLLEDGSIISLPVKVVTDGSIIGLPVKVVTDGSNGKLPQKPLTEGRSSTLSPKLISSPVSPLKEGSGDNLETNAFNYETVGNLQTNLQSGDSVPSSPIDESLPPSPVSLSTVGDASTQSPTDKGKAIDQTESISNGHTDAGKGASPTSEQPVFVSCSNAEELLKSKAYQALVEQEKCLLSREMSVEERPKAPYGSVFTLASEAGRAIEVLLIEEITSFHDKKSFRRWRHLYNKSSLGLWAFRMTLISALPGTVNQYLVAYLPTITNSLGASLDQAANLVTIMGAVDLFSRLGMGLIADTKVLPPSRMLAIAQVIMGTVCQFAWLFTSFPLLILMVLLMGLFVGSRISLLPLVCTEVVGSERMPQAYSISAMSTALMGAIWSPIFGSVAQSTKSFFVVLHLIGTGYLLSGLLMFTLTCFARLDNRRQKDVITEDGITN